MNQRTKSSLRKYIFGEERLTVVDRCIILFIGFSIAFCGYAMHIHGH